MHESKKAWNLFFVPTVLSSIGTAAAAVLERVPETEEGTQTTLCGHRLWKNVTLSLCLGLCSTRRCCGRGFMVSPCLLAVNQLPCRLEGSASARPPGLAATQTQRPSPARVASLKALMLSKPTGGPSAGQEVHSNPAVTAADFCRGWGCSFDRPPRYPKAPPTPWRQRQPSLSQPATTLSSRPALRHAPPSPRAARLVQKALYLSS